MSEARISVALTSPSLSARLRPVLVWVVFAGCFSILWVLLAIPFERSWMTWSRLVVALAWAGLAVGQAWPLLRPVPRIDLGGDALVIRARSVALSTITRARLRRTEPERGRTMWMTLGGRGVRPSVVFLIIDGGAVLDEGQTAVLVAALRRSGVEVPPHRGWIWRWAHPGRVARDEAIRAVLDPGGAHDFLPPSRQQVEDGGS